MSLVATSFAVLTASVWLYLASLAVWCVLRDHSLARGQKIAHVSVAVLAPVVGALFALRLCDLQNPGSVPRSLLPWPFRWVTRHKKSPSNPCAETWEEYKDRMRGI